MVAAVNSAATLIASYYETARSSRVRAPLLIHYHIFKNAGTSFKESVTTPDERAVSCYDSFNSRGFVPTARSGEICQASSGSLFIGNACFDTQPRSAMTQAYGYNEVGNGLKDIKHFGNDYDRNKIGPAHSNSLGGRSNILKIQANDVAGLQISPAMKDKLKALAEDAEMPDSARRPIRECLSR